MPKHGDFPERISSTEHFPAIARASGQAAGLCELIKIILFFVVSLVVFVVPVLLVILLVEVEVLFIFFLVFGRREIEFNGIERDHFEVDPTFRASDDFPDILEFFIDWRVTFRTITHDQPPTDFFRLWQKRSNY